MSHHANLRPGGFSQSRRRQRMVLLLLVVVLCCVGSTETVSAGVNVWTGIGPEGAQVTSLAIDPTVPIILYAATSNGGVFKTTDGGGSWSSVNVGLTNTNVSVVAIDPLTPTTLYAGTNGSGVFKSIDAGGSWRAINDGLTDLDVTALAVNRQTPSIIYVGTSGSGVFKTTDGGNRWSTTGLTDPYITALLLNPRTPTILYVGTYFLDPCYQMVCLSGNLLKSDDGGGSWSETTVDAPVFALAIDPQTPTILYVATGYGVYRDPDCTPAPNCMTSRGGLFKITDGGDKWDSWTGVFGETFYALAIDPSKPTNVYAGTDAPGYVFKSTDGGSSWSAFNIGLTQPVRTLAIDPQTPTTIYAGTPGGVFVVNALAPVVSSIAPTQGAQGATVPVTIGGTGFLQGATVSLSGTGITASNVTVISATQITATLTLASSATADARNVTVTNSDGGKGTLAGAFSVTAPTIAITSVTPNQGVPGATVPVTITGAGFVTGATLSAGADITVSNLTVASSTNMTATLTIAAGAATGPRGVTVTNPGGGNATFSQGFTVVSGVTVTSVSPDKGTAGTAVPVTIQGTGFATGAAIGLSGTGVSASGVTVVSTTQISATLTVATGAAATARDVTVTNSDGGAGTLSAGFTVSTPSSASLSLVYNGKLRDRVGQGSTALGSDGSLDGTLTATLSASGGRTVTGLRLDSDWPTAPGVWRTSSAGTINWVLGAATSLDGALLNAGGSMAVSFPVGDGGSFVVFAADYQSGEFLPGRTLTLTATFSDGSTAVASMTVPGELATISSVTPNQGAQGASVPVTIAGSGFVAGAAVTVNGTGVTVSNINVSSATQLTATFAIAAGAAPGARDVTVTNPGAAGATLRGGFTVTTPSPASLSLAYNGKIRDRVGQGESALGADGAFDGTLTATLSAPGGRTITALRLDSNWAMAPGVWRTSSPGSGNWILGAAASLDGVLLNAGGSMAVSFTVGDGGSFVVFAADYQDGEFLSGRTLTLTATFSDGSTASASTTVPGAPATLALAYSGKLRDRVGQGESALGPDGIPDGTLTATLSAPGGRTITALRLDSNWALAPGVWRTNSPGSSNWVLGAAASLDGALLNAGGSMAVSFTVGDGGSFVVFAADYQGGEFLPGRTLTLTATFSDGSTAVGATTVP